MLWYICIGSVVGAAMDIMRPANRDDVPVSVKIAVPVLSGLFWPGTLAYFVYCGIRRQI